MSRTVWEGGDEKGLSFSAPRQRPTSFGEGRLEKGYHKMVPRQSPTQLRVSVPKQVFRLWLSRLLPLPTTPNLLKGPRFLKRLTQVVRTTISAILRNSTEFSWEREFAC